MLPYYFIHIEKYHSRLWYAVDVYPIQVYLETLEKKKPVPHISHNMPNLPCLGIKNRMIISILPPTYTNSQNNYLYA